MRFVNDSQGTQPDAVVAALEAFPAPVVLIAGGRDKDIDLTSLAPVVAKRAVAAVLIGESGPALEALFRDAGLGRTERAGSLEEAVRRADAIARAHFRTTPEGRRPCSSARPRRASTCSRTTRPADGPSSRPWPTWPQPAPQEEGTDEPRAAPVAPRRTAPRGGSEPGRHAARPQKSTAKSRGAALQRERHQPDYTILVAVVSLASVGILMVYSSSAMRGYLSSANDTFAIVGPQIQWALLGLLAMVGMMRVDYRYLRLVSVPFFVGRGRPAGARLRAVSSTS